MRLADNRDAGVYNIKAVSRLTGVAPDTLRRWESRYSIPSPRRSEGGYRMYSARDVDTIRWLKARVEEGMTISRASELLRAREDAGRGIETVGLAWEPPARATPAAGPRSSAALTQEILTRLGQMDESGASQVLTEALGLYTVEQVVEELIQPVLLQVGEKWMQGDWSVAQEHFASAFFRTRLANLLHGSPFNVDGLLVLVACAPEELHEIGGLILALYLRRAGFRVVYLGQNVPLDSLVSLIRMARPVAVCCSATRPNTAANLLPLHAMLDDLEAQTGCAPLLAYGGPVFNRHRGLAEQMGARYLGSSAADVVRLLRDAVA